MENVVVRMNIEVAIEEILVAMLVIWPTFVRGLRRSLVRWLFGCLVVMIVGERLA